MENSDVNQWCLLALCPIIHKPPQQRDNCRNKMKGPKHLYPHHLGRFLFFVVLLSVSCCLQELAMFSQLLNKLLNLRVPCQLLMSKISVHLLWKLVLPLKYSFEIIVPAQQDVSHAKSRLRPTWDLSCPFLSAPAPSTPGCQWGRPAANSHSYSWIGLFNNKTNQTLFPS